jgi:hypothetical protein
MPDLLAHARDEQSNLAGVIEEFLEFHADQIHEQRKDWLQCELRGYADAIDYYTHAPRDEFDSGFFKNPISSMREASGEIKLLRADGTHAPISHEVAKRDEFFVSLPIEKVQELSEAASDSVVLELPELTTYTGAREGLVVLICKRAELQRMVQAVRGNLVSAIDLTLDPAKEERMLKAMEQRRRNPGPKA